MVNEQSSLVIGASGLVGCWLLRSLGAGAVGTYYRQEFTGGEQLDICRDEAVKKLIQKIQPQVIYCPAANPAVDWCEENPVPSQEINVQGIRNVAQAIKEIGGTMVFFSSDYIFDGREGAYGEDDEPNPICVYGLHKLQAEQVVRELLPGRHIIARIAGVYGWERAGKNFMFRLVSALRKCRQVQVPIDQVNSPTHAPSMARAVIELAEQGLLGTWNVCGPEVMSRYEFASLAAEVFGLNASLIKAVCTEELGQAAPRPLKSSLKVDKLKAVLGWTPLAAKSGLEDMRQTEASWGR